MSFTRLCLAADVAAEKSLGVEIAGKKLLVCQSLGEFYVVINKCSHADEPLDCGRVRNGWVACPVHGARFNLATGEAINPPAKAPIATFAARLTDGWVEADLPD